MFFALLFSKSFSHSMIFFLPAALRTACHGALPPRAGIGCFTARLPGCDIHCRPCVVARVCTRKFLTVQESDVLTSPAWAFAHGQVR